MPWRLGELLGNPGWGVAASQGTLPYQVKDSRIGLEGMDESHRYYRNWSHLVLTAQATSTGEA